MDSTGRTSRRDFIKLTTAATVAAATSTTILAADEARHPERVSPSDKIRLGLIGAGGQGMGDTREALKIPGIELVAVADLYDGRLARTKEIWGNQLFTTRDYREVLARDRKSTRLNSSQANISYAVFCLTKKKEMSR